LKIEFLRDDEIVANRPGPQPYCFAPKASAAAFDAASVCFPAAIANAVFDATGVRIRRYPLLPSRVKKALTA
jgi:hypothetical protein